MTIEQKLMRNIMRTSATARRHPHDKEGVPEEGRGRRRGGARPETREGGHPENGHPHGGHPHKGRGFGHILDLLPEGEGVSQQQIADALGIRPQSVSEAIAVLESRGFVRKEASQRDKRVTLVYITEQGSIRRNEIAEERKAHAVQFFSALTEEEKEELLRLLDKINGSFDDGKEMV